MPKGGNNMDTKSDDQFFDIEATIVANKQESDKNHKETDERITLLTEKHNETHETLKIILAIMKIDNKDISKFSPSHKDKSTPPDPTTTV